MPGASLFSLLDDIASMLDDIAVLTKVAATKTAGVVGDDLALNAHQVSGVKPDRELPVVWAVAKGSAVNKLIQVPVALAVSALAPALITPLLMLGGAYLCYEGVEKFVHKLLHRRRHDSSHAAQPPAAPAEKVDVKQLEREKIRGAIRTDFVLSAEIVVITLGTLVGVPLLEQLLVLGGVAVLMTVGVYGLVAAIVKLDDLGLYLANRPAAGRWPTLQRFVGRGILRMAPHLMKTLSVLGTAAMFTVGGEILVRGWPALEAQIHRATEFAARVPVAGAALHGIAPLALAALSGIVLGLLAVILVTGCKWLWRKLRKPRDPHLTV